MPARTTIRGLQEHQDWFVKRADGTPYDTAWGGTCLDMTHPGAQEYLRGIVRRLTQEWGYRYLKMDGLCTGAGVQQIYVNDAYKEDGIGDAVFQTRTRRTSRPTATVCAGP